MKNFKKGFTLAELLIVFIIMSIIIKMTIPSVMKSVVEVKRKVAYQKALSIVTNILAAQKMLGNLPLKANTDTADYLFDILNSHLNVSGYISDNPEESSLNSGELIPVSNIEAVPPKTRGRYRTWIITEDNLAYLIRKGSTPIGEDAVDSNLKCSKKLDIINSQEKYGLEESASDVCFTIYVDVDGIQLGSNTAYTPIENEIHPDAPLPEVIHDRFPMYIGSNGVTPGSPKVTITGRIAAGIR